MTAGEQAKLLSDAEAQLQDANRKGLLTVVVPTEFQVALAALVREKDEQIAAVRTALAYDSREHHSDAPCTTRCMDAFRERIEAALTHATATTEGAR